MSQSLTLYAGERARAHIQKNGLSAADICAIPAAAGGPKGLVLQGLDQWLFSEWLPSARRRRQLIGASIGAWRMVAATSPNPVAALKRLADQYCDAQRYAKKPSREEVTQVCGGMIREVVADEAHAMVSHPDHELLVWVNRGRPTVAGHNDGRALLRGFAAATMANALNRNFLSAYLERWVMHSPHAQLDWLKEPFDRIPTHFRALSPANLYPSALASGSIPFVLNPVKDIPGCPPGSYWDGGLTDYHLALPYERLDGMVLYPHFADTVTPGWLDKFIKRRKANPQWLSNVIMLAPSREWIASLPAKKIPDRSDFPAYKTDHDRRIAHWRVAIAESERLRDEFVQWLKAPRIDRLHPL